MQNINALITMAQVSQNANNPYAAFGEYIKYCVFSNASKTMTLKEIKERLSGEFGLNMPNNILLKCLTDIQNEGLISYENHQISVCGEFDIETFEKKRTQFKQTEDALIEELIKYVKNYNKTWDKLYAREQLLKVLDGNDLAYDIFINKGNLRGSNADFEYEQLQVEDVEEPLFSDAFYVGKFIDSLLTTDSVYRDYLQNVCEGLMICIGVYQLPSLDSTQNVPQIKDTRFIFDTRLLLRYIGCGSEASVQAAIELVDLIQSNGGKIYYFPHTFEEMTNALEDACKNLTNGKTPHDDEMRIYATSISNKASIMAAKKANLKQELASKKICELPLGNYNNRDRIKFGFDKNDLVQYMLSQLKWELKVIENDAASIWETHMLRRGEYSEYCGTKERLPVFVTTNTALPNIALKYRDERKQVNTILGWKTNRLPIITDMRLTCRLWTPSVQGERLSMLYLSANAVAAQKPTQHYMNCIRELVEELQTQVPEYSQIALPAFFDDNVTNALFEQTKEGLSELTIDKFANTIAELTDWKAKEKEDENNQLLQELDKTSETLNAQTRDIIDGAIEKNVNRMGVAGFVLHLVFWWPVIASALFTAISAVVSKVIENWDLLWIGVTPMLLYVILTLISSKCIEKKILGKIYLWAEQRYEKKIIKELRRSEIVYKNEIILGVKQQTKILIKCKDIM